MPIKAIMNSRDIAAISAIKKKETNFILKKFDFSDLTKTLQLIY